MRYLKTKPFIFIEIDDATNQEEWDIIKNVLKTVGDKMEEHYQNWKHMQPRSYS